MMIRLLTNPDDSLLNGEDRQKSKASAPGRARLEPPGKAIFIQGSRRLYDLPVLSVAGTLSITSIIYNDFVINHVFHKVSSPT
ncbi:hypothetical protein BF17_16305 [Yersinia similis]|uniref:Uncharacterized protein n=1 Tax=Yersinia similis TaxID=367190 RepID=A0ABN4CRL0_9GAMM|nr:hypothetical protein BF17_16305 [Yersinia similis]